MIFEGRATQLRRTAVVKLRDQLEEATALARSNRGTGTPVASARTGRRDGDAPPGTRGHRATTVTGAPAVVPDDGCARAHRVPAADAPDPRHPRVGSHATARSSSGGSNIGCVILSVSFPQKGTTHMGGFSIWHWLIVLVIVVLVFGTKRLGNVGKDLGEAVKGFKKGMSDEDKPAARLPDANSRRAGPARARAPRARAA